MIYDFYLLKVLPFFAEIGGNDLRVVFDVVRRAFGDFLAEINILRNTPGQPIWQRNYFEHIIRSEEELIRIQKYIIYNPRNWEKNLTLS